MRGAAYRERDAQGVRPEGRRRPRSLRPGRTAVSSPAQRSQRASSLTRWSYAPNVTGSLHMGHALNNTIQDVVVRRSRMTGVPTVWVVGTDHAGHRHAEQGRAEARQGGQFAPRPGRARRSSRRVDVAPGVRRQHHRPAQAHGLLCDCDHERFTMDEYQRAVRKVFVRLVRRGLIYRGKRIINWCPRCSTALSDIEVEHEDVDSHLWHLVPAQGAGRGLDHVVVATTRPGDDARRHVRGRASGRQALRGADRHDGRAADLGASIPIVADDYVDPTFGTGAVKVTPAHDPNDFEIGERHGCAKINVMNADAHHLGGGRRLRGTRPLRGPQAGRRRTGGAARSSRSTTTSTRSATATAATPWSSRGSRTSGSST